MSERREVPVTPRKRTPSKRKVPTPNPPLAPFPTPPSSAKRHRPSVASPSIPSPAPSPARTQPNALPAHLETLLALHKGLTLALTLHLAQSPPILPAHDADADNIALENLTSLVQIRAIVERTTARRFGVQELKRLAWVWSWDGETLPAPIKDANPFLATPEPTTPRGPLLSFIITPHQALSPSSHPPRPVPTYGIGISLNITPGETRFVQSHTGVLSGGAGGVGGGIGAVGRWSAEAGAREAEFRKRLEKWVELHTDPADIPTVQENAQLPTPSEHVKINVPQVPLFPLPPLPSGAGTFPGSTLASALEILPSPRRSTLGPPIPLAQGEDVFGKETLVKGKVVRSGTVEERRQAMRDRIAARSGPSTPTKLNSATMSSADLHTELQRRSTLSRLEGVAESVWMLFTSPVATVTSSPGAKSRRRAILLSEVASVVVQSSKTPISTAEAQSSLTLLTELCPRFLTSRTVARQEWLEMPNASLAPPSPSSGPIAVGPASPGRVARVGQGGLREVRERIRRELDGI